MAILTSSQGFHRDIMSRQGQIVCSILKKGTGRWKIMKPSIGHPLCLREHGANRFQFPPADRRGFGISHFLVLKRIRRPRDSAPTTGPDSCFPRDLLLIFSGSRAPPQPNPPLHVLPDGLAVHRVHRLASRSAM